MSSESFKAEASGNGEPFALTHLDHWSPGLFSRTTVDTPWRINADAHEMPEMLAPMMNTSFMDGGRGQDEGTGRV